MSRLVFLSLLLLGSIRSVAQSDVFSRQELKTLRYCKGSPLAFFHPKEMKEFVKLMNLARIDPDLLEKYLNVVHDSIAADYELFPWEEIRKSHKVNGKRITILRPSFGLHLGAFYHAFFGGRIGRVGHQYLDERLLWSLNLNVVFTKVPYGENCDYGARKGVYIFYGLINSPPHRRNILYPQFMRVGVSNKWHKRYETNTVSVFTGPKLQDWILYRKESKRVVSKKVLL